MTGIHLWACNELSFFNHFYFFFCWLFDSKNVPVELPDIKINVVQ